MNRNFGEKLRSARHAKKTALKDLAAECGLSYSYISQVERGEASPSLSALDSLAKALGTTVWELLRDDSSEAPAPAGSNIHHAESVAALQARTQANGTTRASKVVRKDGRRSVILPQSNILYQMLTPDLNRELQLLIVEAEPDTDSGDQALSHGGEECCFVISGKFEIDVGEETFVLEKGDSIYFSSELPHRWRNIGNEKLVLLLAVTPPAY